MGRVEEDRTADYETEWTESGAGPVELEDEGETAAGPSGIDIGDQSRYRSSESEADSDDAVPAAAVPAAAAGPAAVPAAAPAAARPPNVTRRTRKRARGVDEQDRQAQIERLLLESLRRTPPAPQPPPSEDELFLKSLVPSLQRLLPQRNTLNSKFINLFMNLALFCLIWSLLNSLLATGATIFAGNKPGF